tara:strand:+ start:49 stop:177 length:129 start_codon:yes stop_codon:yes gene_type:complete
MKKKLISIIKYLFKRNKKQIKPKINKENIVRNKFGFPQINKE